MIHRLYSLHHCEKVYRQACAHYSQCCGPWDSSTRDEVQSVMTRLRQALDARDRRSASEEAHALARLIRKKFRKPAWRSMIELVFALTVAISFALIVRQMWFELYEIPTGSMRPTFREQDRLLVSKTTFGLNIPAATDHFFFCPDSVQRGGVVIWSGENINLPDTDSRFLGVIPYTKRYIKRMIGKPGDSFYFYGGQLWGVDSEGNDLSFLRTDPWMQDLEHLPFSNFEGNAQFDGQAAIPTALVRHFGIPVGRIRMLQNRSSVGEVLVGDRWEKERRDLQFTDYFGMGNFAMARVLRPDQLSSFSDDRPSVRTPLYLQLGHHPQLEDPSLQFAKYSDGSVRALMTPLNSALIPLDEQAISRLFDTLYTGRFLVRSERGIRYSPDRVQAHRDAPSFAGVPDGTYEFYNGIGYRVGFGGHLSTLAADHPLMARTPENLYRLFNFGIEVRDMLEGSNGRKSFYPSRYAYFRNGDLYVMGGKIFEGLSDALREFNGKERSRAGSSYLPFIDQKPHLNRDGSVNVDFIRQFGVTVPEKHYMVLGDNHAMSADSRAFGFVPEGNIEGSPSVIIWPWQDRLGPPPQKSYPWINPARVLIWVIVLTGWMAYRMWSRKRELPALPFETSGS